MNIELKNEALNKLNEAKLMLYRCQSPATATTMLGDEIEDLLLKINAAESCNVTVSFENRIDFNNAIRSISNMGCSFIVDQRKAPKRLVTVYVDKVHVEELILISKNNSGKILN